MLLGSLVGVSEQISATKSKKAKVELIAGLLLQAHGRETELAAHYVSGQLPQGRLGVGWKMLQDALSDLPLTPRCLSLADVDAFFTAIAKVGGPGSMERKGQMLRQVFSPCEDKERSFLVKLIMSEMRQGALLGLVLEGIARASSLPYEPIQMAFMFSGSIGEVARIVIEEGAAGLVRFGPKLFQPISPMLASPVEDEQEALHRHGIISWEYKIDGARIQIHKEGDEVRIFTRHLKEVTASIPEIVALARTLPVKEAILEGEAIALREDGKRHLFQTTMRRFGRIKHIEHIKKILPLTPYLFDLLFRDGKALFQAPYKERIDVLAQTIPPELTVPRVITADETKARDFLRQSIAAGHEGLMAKALNSPYMAGQGDSIG